MYSFSTEELGQTVYAYMVPLNSGARVSGLVLGDFTVKLYDPSGVDIAGSTSISVSEFGSTGAYRFSVLLPSTGEGNYTLRVEDVYSAFPYSCVFMAYKFPPHTDTNDASAQMELYIYDSSDNPVSGVVIGDLTVRVWNPSMVESSGSVTPTLVELESGHYMFEFDASSAEGIWFVDLIHATYFASGQQGDWRYEVPEDYTPPTITDVDTSIDGLTVEVDIVVGGAPFTVVQLMAHTGEIRDTDQITGSGTVTLTRTVAEYGIVIAYGSDEDGAIVSDPAAETVPSTTDPGGGAADDNVRVAIRTMKQTAVYWAPSGVDRFGKPTYDTPVLITCRWEKVIEEFIDANGDRVMSEAKLIVDRDLKEKGVLFLGVFADLTSTTNPFDNEQAWEIMLYKKTPDFKGRRFLREVWL